MNKPHPFSPSFPTDERKKVGKKEKKSLPPPSPLAPTYSVRNTNNTTSWSTTSISRSLALFVTAFTQIVGARMYDNSPLKIYISHIFFRNFSKPFSFMGERERERERFGGGGGRGKGREDGCGVSLTPKTLVGPISLTFLSVIVPSAFPLLSVLKFPKSPT